jgi:hypothetical protein
LPFNRLVDGDPDTGQALALPARGQPTWIIANNKTGGDAPPLLPALHEALCRERAMPATQTL